MNNPDIILEHIEETLDFIDKIDKEERNLRMVVNDFKLRCYYAHPMILYSSNIEQQDIETLEKMGFVVENPNHPSNEEAYIKSKDFSIFLNLVNKCDVLAFRSVVNKITAGVAKEIQYAKELGIPVIELPTITTDRILSIEETVEYFRPRGIKN